MTNVNLLI